jgi:hypothetical protein
LNRIKRTIANEARQASPWPRLECSGCNVTSPLTEGSGAPIYGISRPASTLPKRPWYDGLSKSRSAYRRQWYLYYSSRTPSRTPRS